MYLAFYIWVMYFLIIFSTVLRIINYIIRVLVKRNRLPFSSSLDGWLDLISVHLGAVLLRGTKYKFLQLLYCLKLI